MKLQLIIFSLLFFAVSSLKSQSYEIFKEGEKYGLKTAKTKTAAEYNFIYHCKYEPNYVVLETQKQVFLYNTKTDNKIKIYNDILDYLYEDSCFLTSDNCFRFQTSEGIGYMRFPEIQIVKPVYDFLYPIEQYPNYMLLQRGKNEFSIYDIHAKTKTDWFFVSDYYGLYIDNWICYMPIEERIAGKIGEKWYIIEMNGTMYEIANINSKKFSLNEYENELLPTVRNGKYGFMNKTGELKSPCIYENALAYVNYFAAPVKKNGKWGLYGLDSCETVPCCYESLTPKKEYAFLAAGNKVQIEIDETGLPVFLSLDYNENTKKYGFRHSKNSKLLIPQIYDFAFEFEGSLAIVNIGGVYNAEKGLTEGGKWGYILPTGEVWIDCIFDEVDYFSGGKAFVKKDGEEFYIDFYGNRVE